MNGRPGSITSNFHFKLALISFTDLLKGSYYANPIVDKPSVSPEHIKEFCEYYSNNICMWYS
jgi:hypothetical protein